MPLYEYECASCQKVHEVMQKFSDAPLANCPDCNGAVTKLVSMSSFALKGSGWYTTDYKAKPSAAATPAKNGETAVASPAAAAPASAAPAAASASGVSTGTAPATTPKTSGGSTPA